MKKLLLLFSMMLVMPLFKSQKSVYDIARTGTVQELKDLMSHDKEVINTPNEQGFSPLILACYRGNTEVAEFLINNVKDINYKSNEGTALAGLSIRYNKDLVLALLKKKADPNIADANGTTPLIWATKTGNEELVKLLLEYKADPEKADNLGFKPFEYAMKSGKTNIINLLKKN